MSPDDAIPEVNIREVARSLAEGSVVALTGAGVSTASGIPDYRDERGAWKRPAPVQYRDFVHSEATRRRYWARSFIGWPGFRAARPNLAHYVLADLERKGLVALLVTQNVDGLHQASGSRRVVDLHGRLDRVVCLQCGQRVARDALQAELSRLNPGFQVEAAIRAPDGDAELLGAAVEDFRLAPCAECGGTLKPDVVFYGESVPAARVEDVMASLERARTLLVVGSSLLVFSGFRFARAARRLGVRIVVVNRGLTRADELSERKLNAEAGAALSAVLRAIDRVSEHPRF